MLKFVTSNNLTKNNMEEIKEHAKKLIDLFGNVDRSIYHCRQMIEVAGNHSTIEFFRWVENELIITKNQK
jgi:hypothetical protein